MWLTICQITEITSRSQIPIVVGGTMYFIQHLLFPGYLVSAGVDEGSKINASTKTLEQMSSTIRERARQLPPELLELLFLLQGLPSISTSASLPSGFPIARLPEDYRSSENLSAGLFQILRVLDPPMAEKWHWRDIRKVRRSVEIVLQTGRPYSDIVADQHARATNDTQFVLVSCLQFGNLLNLK